MRGYHQVVVFDSKMYLIGGSEENDDDTDYKNDVWSSADGATWTEVTIDAAFVPRGYHQVVVFPAEK